jgi:4-amino-4-deoxy-L-arabinose transferase-like glycosyltransferase
MNNRQERRNMAMTKLQRRILVAILAVSVVARVFAAIYLGNSVVKLPGTFDQLSYHNLALRFVSGHGFTFGEPWWPATAADAPTAHWSYLYTGYLILIYKIFGLTPLIARIIQAVIVGVLQPYLAYRIGRYLFNPLTGLAAAFLTAIYAYFIYYSATLMTEPFYIVAILASLLISMHMVHKEVSIGDEQADIKIQENLWVGVLLGLTLGIAILMRQIYLLVVPFVFAWIWWASGKRLWRSLMISALTIILMVIPFTISNYLRFERFVLLNTNAGYALFWSNHPVYGTNFVPILTNDMGSYDSLIPEELLSLDEASLDQELLKLGIGFIAEDPLRYLQLSISRIPPYFMFWPTAESSLISNLSRVFSFGIMLPFMLYGLYRSYIGRVKPLVRQPLFLLYMFIILYTGIHILTWTLVRYRLPVDAVLLIFAGLALVDVLSRVPRAKEWITAAA